MNWKALFRSDEYLTWMKSIRANPDDDLPRLIFADWLEENGDNLYCHFIRQQCENCLGTGKESASRDTNGQPSTRQIQEGFIRREVIEQVFPMLAGSYKLSRGFISEVTIRHSDFTRFDDTFGSPFICLWEALRCTQPPFAVVIEPLPFVINNGEWETLSGRFTPDSYYQRRLDEQCENQNGNVCPISKWCAR